MDRYVEKTFFPFDVTRAKQLVLTFELIYMRGKAIPSQSAAWNKKVIIEEAKWKRCDSCSDLVVFSLLLK